MHYRLNLIYNELLSIISNSQSLFILKKENIEISNPNSGK